MLRIAALDDSVPTVLLTGDIERAQELELTERVPRTALRADVLLVPHHGSLTSSSPAFLDAVAPRLAVVQAGYLNRFQHPCPDVLARYRERGITLARTDRDGAVIVDLGPSALQMQAWRAVRARYWQGR